VSPDPGSVQPAMDSGLQGIRDVLGVSQNEFESVWRVFGDALADRFGMEYEQWLEDEWLFQPLSL